MKTKEQYNEIRLNALALGFEDWWTKYAHAHPEAVKSLEPYKPIAKAAWKARDEQVIAMADLIMELLQQRRTN